MKRNIFCLGMLAFGMTVVGCDDGSTDDNGNGNGNGNGTPVLGSTLADKLTWVKNESNVQNGQTYTITVSANESIAPQTISYTGKSATIELIGSGGERTISLSTNSTGRLFSVGSGVTLVLGNNITLQGKSDNSNSLVQVNSGGTLEMKVGSKITGNKATASVGGSFGGGVYVNENGTFTMNGGEISGNSTGGNSGSTGGGVYVYGGTFTMNSGKISGNSTPTTSMSYGGGVAVHGNFIMNGGEISGNNAAASSVSSGYGGGVYVGQSTATIFTMNGGEIKGNIAGYEGGGVFVERYGTFRMVNGTVYGSVTDQSIRNNAFSGAALFVSSDYPYGTAQRGTFSGETWTSKGNLVTRNSNGSGGNNDTITVVNGVLQ